MEPGAQGLVITLWVTCYNWPAAPLDLPILTRMTHALSSLWLTMYTISLAWDALSSFLP